MGSLSWLHAAPAPPLVESRLAKPSAAPTKTLFTRMAPEQTGVRTSNPYDDPTLWGERYQEFIYGTSGTGVAIGDYDQDGRPDLVLVDRTGGARLLRNLGQWKFEDVTESAGLDEGATDWTSTVKGWFGLTGAGSGRTWTLGVTFADVNNDGRLDLYVCRFAAPNALYINQGDGTFEDEAEKRGLAVVDASGMGAFCDYDRDGWLDVYVQTNLLNSEKHPEGQRDYLFHNNGDGTFSNVTDRAGIRGQNQCHSATWWDYDADGWPDLYVANDFAVPDFLYRNNRDGTFTNVIDRAVPHTPHSSMGADLGDVNNDGRIDFLVADMATTTHEKDQRGMARIRAMLNATEEDGPAAPQYMRSALYLSTGSDRLQEAASLAGLEATDWTWAPRLEDLDNDGRLDVFITNGMVRELHNVDLQQRISTSESVADRVRLMKESPVLAEANLAYRNKGQLEFENVSAAWGLDEVGVSFGSALGDLDGDGDLDLVYTNYERGPTLLRNDSPSGHRLLVELRGVRSNRFGVGAVVRVETESGVQVRQLVLARGLLSSSEPVLHFGLGNDAQVNRLTVEWPSGIRQEFSGIAADRRISITESGEPDGSRAAAAAAKPPTQFQEVAASRGWSIEAREPKRDRGMQPLLPFRQDRRGPALAVGDLDGNGRADLLFGGTAESPVTRVANLEAASPLPLPPTGVSPGPLLLFDANADDHLDLLVTRSGSRLPARSADYAASLWLNDGQGRLQPAGAGQLPPYQESVGAALAADFNRDGRLDLLLAGRSVPGSYPLPARTALFLSAGPGFQDATPVWAPELSEVGIVTSALASDVDADGWVDLLLALEWGPVKYFHNDRGRRLEDWSDRAGFAQAGTGWWTSLASADFNGDGRMDYVAGNAGLNTGFRATREQPQRLFFGSFAGPGSLQLIQAVHERERIYPLRSRNELASALPWILKRFPKNDDFARATIEQILGAERLASAQRFYAQELQSGVFLSRPDGTFEFRPLPRIAQIGPAQGMAAGDFDGDGLADLYLVQNSHAPIPSIGRFDGGLSQLLLGDGRGGFVAVPPAESGLFVSGDGEALCVVDFDDDGWPDFVVSRNQEASLAFRNSGKPGHHPLRVTLRGPAGNRIAAGARVSLEFTDGSRQTADVHAGSSYYSQSGPECFFGYREGQLPKRVRVRWPSGKTTDHPVPVSATRLTVEAP